MGRLQDRVAIVTGAGEGVGLGVAPALASEGAKVVCANPSAEKGEALAAGIVGGALRVHPAARLCLEILGVEHASELARVAASVGLASNLAALRALSIEGIQRGHMDLHRRA